MHYLPLSPPDRISSLRGVRQPPYLQRLDAYLDSLQMPWRGQLPWPKGVDVWIVDGVYIRHHIDIEFDNYGQWWDFSYIPRNEAWVDRETQLDEWQFFLTRMEVERRLLGQHVRQQTVWARAKAAERALRRVAGDLRNSGDVYVGKRPWKKLRSRLRVWIVSGRLVRSRHDLDFTAGGHDLVYPRWVPRREIWIDDDVAEGERVYVLLHELRERELMRKGSPYHAAHDSANHFESTCRAGLIDLEEALELVGWY
jgi:hypothetical protein